ncbi:MAG: prepilin peptidase, partial [Candidatus Micrarchaeia archaeon]
MFESFLLQRIELSGEAVRVAIALAGTAAAAFYDLRNNRTVPDRVLYAFLALALLANLVYFQPEVFVYGIAAAALIFGAGYLSYKLGYVGEADVYVLTSLALLLPVFPSWAKAL